MELVEQVKKRFNELYKAQVTPWVFKKIPKPIEEFTKFLKNYPEKKSLLDIGCGNGWISLYLASKGINVVGIDSSKIAIEDANSAKNKSKTKKVKFEVADFLKFSTKRNFDIVVDRGLFHHIPKTEWKKYMSQLSKLLRENGLFYLEVFSYNKKGKTSSYKSKDKRNDYWTYNSFFSKESIQKMFSSKFSIERIIHNRNQPIPTYSFFMIKK